MPSSDQPPIPTLSAAPLPAPSVARSSKQLDSTTDGTNGVHNEGDLSRETAGSSSGNGLFSLNSLSQGLAEERQRERLGVLRDLTADELLASQRRYTGGQATDPVPSDAPPLPCAVGFREKPLKGEDTHDVRDATLGGRTYKMIGVYDGHGGKQASDFCALHLLRYVEEAAAATKGSGSTLADMAAACEEAFLRCHQELRATKGCIAGTTATVLVIDSQRREVLCCNVGDSSVLVVDQTYYGFASTDHRLHGNLDEQNRVLQVGSRLAYAMDPFTRMPAGSLRLWPGGLAVGRSLGDADCGEAVSAIPAVETVELPAHGGHLIMCSDGVWDSLGMYEVATIARSTPDVHKISRKIVTASLKNRGLRDDITCIVVRLGEAESMSHGTNRGSESEDMESSLRPENAMAAFCCGPPLKRLLRYCGCTQVVLEVDMEASIKGGSAFEELYRGEDVVGGDESFQSATNHQQDMDTSRSFSQWAIGRISHDLELGCSVGASTHDESSTAPSTPAPASPTIGPAAAPAAGAGVPRPALPGHMLAADGASPVGFRKRVAILPDGPKPPGTPAKAAHSAAPPSPTLKLPIPIPPGRKIHWNEIGEGGFSDMKYLGSGEFCSVFSTTIDGGSNIAIKMLRQNKLSSTSAARDLEFEMHLMSRIHHKHVLRCIGTSVPDAAPDRKFIALQTLQTTLHEALPPPPLADGTSTLARMAALKRWPMSRSLQLSLELAVALRYLHDQCFATYRLLHRDIKPRNLGIMRDGRLVVFDFGISKLVRRSTFSKGSSGEDAEPAIPMTGMVGSLRYMAPEIALMQPYNHKSEVYSFAIVLWETVALRRPFENILPETFEQRVCVDKERPKLNEKKWPPALCALLSRCWTHNFAERPEFQEVVNAMMTIVAEGARSSEVK